MPKKTSNSSKAPVLGGLRQAMQENGLDAYIIPSQDPHQSEYVADHWQARRWLTGFTGSAGTAVVTASTAHLWTDSRYFIQAEAQLSGSGFELQKLTVPYTAEHLEWLCEHLPSGAAVGCDARLFTVSQARSARRKLAEKHIELSFSNYLIDDLWADRPPLPGDEVFELEQKYAGQTRADKLNAVRSKMKEGSCYLVTALDEIAWLLNIRGNDVECNPVAISYFLLGPESAQWFIDPGKVPDRLKQSLEQDGISINPYAGIAEALRHAGANQKIGYQPEALSVFLYELLEAARWMKTPNLIAPLKAVRNTIEKENLKLAMRKDGVALLHLYRWLEDALDKGASPTEFELGEKLAGFRAEQEGYFGESFPAIVGYTGNGAIVHYRAEADTAARIRPEGILLLDSGGQYREGTTDITRTVALGPVSEKVKDHYTRVLKGHIGLSSAIFPEGTTGVQLDILARQHLWAAGLNYGHGTGHGVGHFLNVHEGPQGITPNPRTSRGQTPIVPGMLTSNEPGFYKADEYGIRIENLDLCVEKMETDTGKFYTFEPQTLFPIATDLILLPLLSTEERQWLNEYHARVLKELSPLLNSAEQAWLEKKCRQV